MALYQYKTILLVVFVATALVVASPALEPLIVYPKTESLSEFWLYGSNHDAKYPSNVTSDQSMPFYICGSDHMGEAAYYQIEIKFRDVTQPGPDSFNHTPSTLEPLSRLTAIVPDNGTFELPVDVSFQYEANPTNSSQLNVKSVTVNGNALPINQTISWSNHKSGFYGNLFFELWLYNQSSNMFVYHERYISLWLRMEF